MSISSSPLLLRLGINFLRKVVDPKWVWFNVKRNLVLRYFLRRTFYDQFCAGDRHIEVRDSLWSIRKLGYTGVILEYGPEVLDLGQDDLDARVIEANIMDWRKGLLQTIEMTDAGDFVGLKWSGMGRETLRLLQANQAPSPSMEKAMEDVCNAAAARNVALLPAAEPQNANKAVDAWTLELSRKYNVGGRKVIYNTYQCYLKSTASILASHMRLASEQRFGLGIKLVRGAYLHSEARHLIWENKTKTDENYDAIAEALVRCDRSSRIFHDLKEGERMPPYAICLATHNDASVQKVKRMRDEQVRAEQSPVPLCYASLQGMADEVSCGIVNAEKDSREEESEVPRVYKCVTWGRLDECLNYLLRRAIENRDAMSRTVETRKAMGKELWRRVVAFTTRRWIRWYN